MCDCPAHEWLGRECICTCDHSKDQDKPYDESWATFVSENEDLDLTY